jgi:ribonuclease D
MLVRFDRDRDEFDDQEFNKFCQDHNIIRIEKEFINTEGNIYYSFFIEYLPRKTTSKKPDLNSLNELEQEQYQSLRDWRNELAANEGLPAYIVMYNAQLYEIIKKQPKSISDFASIKGMKEKGEKYGERIIKLLQETQLKHEE